MEIEFNPGRVGKPQTAQPVARSGAGRTESAEAPFSNIDAVEAKLKDIPWTRPEKVEQARPLVSNLKYPPDEVLNGLANLLALHMR